MKKKLETCRKEQKTCNEKQCPFNFCGKCSLYSEGDVINCPTVNNNFEK